MIEDVLDRRRRERRALIDLARRYAVAVSERLNVRAAVVVGSVGRGDFNAWSDVDVLVIADDLPDGAHDRMKVLHDSTFAGVQPIGWTADEFAERNRRGDPIATAVHGHGVVVYGTVP
jgi:uncharacterized protein